MWSSPRISDSTCPPVACFERRVESSVFSYEAVKNVNLRADARTVGEGRGDVEEATKVDERSRMREAVARRQADPFRSGNVY